MPLSRQTDILEFRQFPKPSGVEFQRDYRAGIRRNPGRSSLYLFALTVPPQALGLMREVEVERGINLEMTPAQIDYNTAIVSDIERAFWRASAPSARHSPAGNGQSFSHLRSDCKMKLTGRPAAVDEEAGSGNHS